MSGGRVPLAWHNLMHDKVRAAVAAAGVGFAVILMFVQIGFYNGALDSPTAPIQALNGEIVVMSSARYALTAEESFPLARLTQATSCRGVRAATPLYMQRAGSVLRREGGRGFPIRTFAVDPANPALRLAGIEALAGQLDQPETALIDAATRELFGIPEDDDELRVTAFEIAGDRIDLIGRFQLSTDLSNDGNLLMSVQNLARYFPHRTNGDPLSRVELGVLQLDDGADPRQVKAELQKLLPEDVVCYTVPELDALERRFWSSRVPVGSIFSLGAAMGFIVGIVICYQIIYSDAASQLPEFATLKAMGYRSGHFYRVIMQQALYIALLGFLPGLVVSFLLYDALSDRTGLLLQLTPLRVLLVLACTMAMCQISAVLAIRKVLKADPADLF
jgi:putative ABC transport system permease protein